MRLLTGLMSLLLLCCGCSSEDGGKTKHYIKIGTGSQTGVYYTVGLALADMVNEGEDSHGVDCAVEATAGSVFNINTTLSGELDFALAQADRQYQAVNGLGSWQGDPQNRLRFVCSLHPEAVTLVVADDANIGTIKDLRNKIISIGAAGSGTRGNALDILGEVGLHPDTDFIPESLTITNASTMLQDSRIHGFFYTAGHPNGSITQATNGMRKVHLVSITEADGLLGRHPYYTMITIPKGFYPQATNTEDIETIGMLTTLLTASDVDDEVVYTLTKTLFEGLDKLHSHHPTLTALKPKAMLEGAFAPIHPGAMRYYKEAGLME